MWRNVGARYGALAVVCLGANAITAIIKVIVQRPRPATGRYLDYSFPSGHTTFAAAVLGFATLLALQQRRYSMAATSALIVAAMGPSRVLLGVHWLSDVAAGYAIGFAWLIFVLLVGLPWARDARNAQPHTAERVATSPPQLLDDQADAPTGRPRH
jgi:undecaprenyl-diphosphatase